MLKQLEELNQLDLGARPDTDDAVRMALLEALGIVLAARQCAPAKTLERELSGLESGTFRFPGGERLSALAAIAVAEAGVGSAAPTQKLAFLVSALLPLTLARDATVGSLISALLAGAVVRESGLGAGAATTAAVAWLGEASPAATVALALANAHAPSVQEGVLRALTHPALDDASAGEAATSTGIFVLPTLFGDSSQIAVEHAREETAARFMRRTAPAVKPEQSLIFATNLFLCERGTPFRMLWDTLF